MRCMYFLLLIALGVLLSACSEEPSSGQHASYDSTKKMVVDILQTDEGKKTLSEVIADKKVKEQLVTNSEDTKKTIADALTSDKGKEMWASLFKDPEFKADFAKSMADEQKKTMKALMNDPEYQKQMLALMQNPKMQEQMLTVMKSEKFRSHLDQTMIQTFETPAFQKKVHDMLTKAAEDAVKKKEKESK